MSCFAGLGSYLCRSILYETLPDDIAFVVHSLRTVSSELEDPGRHDVSVVPDQSDG